MQWFALYVTRSTSSWLIVLSCIDRFFHSSSNARIRRISSLKTARIAIGMTSSIVFIIHTHIIIYYGIIYVSDRYGNINPSCTSQPGNYRTFLGFWNLIIYSFGPSVIMFLFGLLTLKNIRQLRSVVPVAFENNRIVRRTDTQLLLMLFGQVLVIIICTLPISAYQLYSSFTANIVGDTLRTAEESFASRLAHSMIYFAHSITFYLYTLTGTVFRKELFKIIRRCCHPNRNLVVMVRDEKYQMADVERT